ncbi:hypothetical protein [Azospirillum sp. sgz302134]
MDPTIAAQASAFDANAPMTPEQETRRRMMLAQMLGGMNQQNGKSPIGSAVGGILQGLLMNKMMTGTAPTPGGPTPAGGG